MTTLEITHLPSPTLTPAAVSNRIFNFATGPKISHERSIWTLYLFRHQVENVVTKEYQVKGISVAGLGDLFAGFYSSAEIMPLMEMFEKYISTLVDVFSKYVTNKIEKGIDSYRRAVDQSIDAVDQKKALELQTLKQHKSALCTLLNASTYLPKWKSNVGSR